MSGPPVVPRTDSRRAPRPRPRRWGSVTLDAPAPPDVRVWLFCVAQSSDGPREALELRLVLTFPVVRVTVASAFCLCRSETGFLS